MAVWSCFAFYNFTSFDFFVIYLRCLFNVGFLRFTLLIASSFLLYIDTATLIEALKD